MGNTVHTITNESIEEFIIWLRNEDRSEGTIQKYKRDITRLMSCLSGRPLTKERINEWKEKLISEEYNPVTVNSMIAAVNTYCRFAGLDIVTRFLKIQRRLYREDSRELSQKEYEKLIETAERTGNHKMALLMETIAATGIRVSEVKYITVEAVKNRKTQISLKRKIRDIMIPGKLCRKLLKFAEKNKIAAGEIFVTGSGKSISRKQIWASMKAICRKAGVAETKVFPHNLRHLFARVYYRVYKDVAKLADLLGHSSIETTRIYLISTGEEHARQLEKLRLVR